MKRIKNVLAEGVETGTASLTIEQLDKGVYYLKLNAQGAFVTRSFRKW